MAIVSGSRAPLFRTLAVVSTLAVAACGGGGGGASSPVGPTLPPAPAPGPTPAPPVATGPTISTQPAAQTAGAGTTATFSVVSPNATSYQWQRSTDGGVTWSDVPGATGTALTVGSPGLVDSGQQFRVTLANAQGTATSTAAILTVRPNLRLLAGAIGGEGHYDAVGIEARFGAPRGVAVDAAGNVFVADGANHVIRRITAAGAVSTVAGVPGQAGRTDGLASGARFDIPRSIAVDGAGVLWVVDQGTCWLRKISGGQVTSVAALGFGNCAWQSRALASASEPTEVAVAPSGDVFVSDRRRHVIRRIDGSGAVSTFAGVDGMSGVTDGPRLGALFGAPRGLAFDASGVLYVADSQNCTVRRIAADGTVSTVAGTAGACGHVDATGSAARFAGPRGIAVAGSLRLVISDVNDHTVRQIDLASGVVSTLAGAPFSAGSADGMGSAARFDAPFGIAGSSSGVAYVADTNSSLIRRVQTDGVVSRLAGQVNNTGTADGSGASARFSWTNQIVSDGAGNVYMADRYNDAIRKISPTGAVTTLAGVAGQPGYADGAPGAARFFFPTDLAIAANGDLFVADTGNCVIRQVTPSGDVLTRAGVANSCGYDDGPIAVATMGYFAGIAANAAGDVAFSQDSYCVLRRISGMVVSIAAGTGECAVVDGPAAAARVARPTALVFEANGSLLFVDRGPTIRRLRTDGSVETIAGSTRGNTDGPGASAKFEDVTSLAVDPAGRIYVADSGNQAVRLIGTDRSVRTLIPLSGGPRVVLGEPGALNYPVGLALLPGSAIAITSERSVLLD